MKFLILFVCWMILLVLCWPLAFLALLLLPIIWLVALPFRIAFAVVEGVLSFVHALLCLPARILRGSTRTAS